MTTQFDLPSPVVYVDLDIAERNIARLARLAGERGISVRPHIKAHKSVYFAKKQIEAGAHGITVAKIAEAEVMAEHGIDDIFIAFPIVGAEKLARLRKLHERIRVATTVDSLDVARGLATVGTEAHPLPVLIEVDCGLHRCGLQSGDVLNLASSLKQYPELSVHGLMTYNGDIYAGTTDAERARSAAAENALMGQIARELEAHGFNMSVLSGGSTPSIRVLEQYTDINEIRPGNYIFNDVMGLEMVTATEDDCALRILATVVSIPLPGQASTDAGSKTLTSDPPESGTGYGHVVGMPDVEIQKLNEEHGYLRFDPARRDFKVGDRIEIIPNHACVIANLQDRIYAFHGSKYEGEITVEARGKNY